MPLDVFINGADFGETIILRWEEGGLVCGGIVDCYATEDGERECFDVCAWLDELRITRLRFAVATHPHLDHLQHFDKLLAKFEKKTDAFYYWGVLEPEMWVEYFEALKMNRSNGAKAQRLPEKAQHALNLIAQAHQMSKPEEGLKLATAQAVTRCFPLDPKRSSMVELHSLGPWSRQRKAYLRRVGQSIDASGAVSEEPGAANAVSSAFLVKYGQAEIVLGGDMEGPNWRALRKSGVCPEFNPCLIKVSHHGSKTGKIPGMWDGGFFGSKRRPLIAVVTPWNGRLPERPVLRRIKRAVTRFHVTGQKSAGRGRSLRSFVHVKVSATGEAEVVTNSPNAGQLFI